MCIRRVLVLLIIALTVSGCSIWGDGPNDEDRHRLTVLSEDPVATLLPPGAVSTDAPSEILATTDNVQLSGCCTSAVVQRFESEAAPADTMQWYVDQLERLGWQDIVVDCRTLTSRVGAYKQFDSFVGHFRAEVSHAGPPHHLFQDVNAWFHTSDNPEPKGETPSIACLTPPS